MTTRPPRSRFSRDLPALTRRGALGTLAATLAAPTAHAATCTALPPGTAGRFPADGTNRARGRLANVLTEKGVLRQDLRPSFAGLRPVARGTRLDLDIRLTDTACNPLPGRALYVWMCDAAARYSIYEAPDRNYLRGLAIADRQGRLRFTTVFPGCYRGRWPHVHFEVFDSPERAITGRAARLTSQFAFPEDVSRKVYADTTTYPGSTRNLAALSYPRDVVFRRATAAERKAQMSQITRTPRGLTAEITIALP